MQTIHKKVADRSKKVIYEYDLPIAETIAECLQLCNGREQDVVSIFNDGYARYMRKAMKPKEPTKKRMLLHARRAVSPEVRAKLMELTEEQQYELIKQAREKTESYKARASE